MSNDPQQSAFDEIMAKINELQQESEVEASPQPETEDSFQIDQDIFDEIKESKGTKAPPKNKSAIRRFIDGEEDEVAEEELAPLTSTLYDDAAEEIEDFDEPDDRDEIYRDLKNIVGKMAVKSVFLFMLCLSSLYLFVSGFYPALFGGSVENVWFRMAMLTVDVLCFAVSVGIFAEGAGKLLHARADTDTLLALMWLAVTVVRVVGLIKPSFFPVRMDLEPMLCIGLYYNVSSKKKIASNIKKNFKYISATSDKLTVTVPPSCETNNALILETGVGGEVMYAHSTDLVSEYIKHSYSDFELDRPLHRFLFIGVVLILFASIMLSQLVGVAVALLFPAAALAISVPFFSRHYYAASIARIGKKIRRNGGILTSVHSARELADSELLVVSEEDFIGKDAVLLQGVKALGNTQIEDLITNIAALFSEVGTPLKPLFAKMIDQKSVNLPRVDDIYYHEGKGYSCLIHSKMFLVGNAAMMEYFNIDFPDEIKNIKLKNGRYPVFVAYQKSPAGIFITSYEHKADTEAAICFAAEEQVDVGIVSNDFLFCEDLLKSLYPETHPEYFHFISSALGEECREHLQQKEKSPDLIASISGVKGLLACLLGSGKLLASLRINRIIRVLYTVLSLLLIFFIALSGYSANTALQILAFQLIWMLPVCAICTFCK